jgi:hypothetical protein
VTVKWEERRVPTKEHVCSWTSSNMLMLAPSLMPQGPYPSPGPHPRAPPTLAPHPQVYMYNMLSAGEKVLATLRLELFRTLLMQRLSFFDRHTTAELTSLISVELDAVRSFIFK